MMAVFGNNLYNFQHNFIMILQNICHQCNLSLLSESEKSAINGGADLPYLGPSVFTYYLLKFAQAAAEYQSSLPPNLKK